MTNFISVRADKNKGDLKEVVRRKIVLKYMYNVPNNVKRIPPGLLWVKIAEDYNCLSFNNTVAIKNYLDEGITSRCYTLKLLIQLLWLSYMSGFRIVKLILLIHIVGVHAYYGLVIVFIIILFISKHGGNYLFICLVGVYTKLIK